MEGFRIQRKFSKQSNKQWENIAPLKCIKGFKTLKETEDLLIKKMEYDKVAYLGMNFTYRIIKEKIDVIKVINGGLNE